MCEFVLLFAYHWQRFELVAGVILLLTQRTRALATGLPKTIEVFLQVRLSTLRGFARVR